MRLKFLAVPFALTALLLAGCQGKDPAAGSPSPEQSVSPSQKQSESPSQEQSEPPSPEQSESPSPEQSEPPSPEQSESPSPEPSESVFTPGTWLVNGGGQYFFFDRNGTSGRTADWEYGIGAAFVYEYEDGHAVFHMAAVDNNSPCTVEVTDPEHLTLLWDDGHSTDLTYISSQVDGEFRFYSNSELCDLAVAYYKQASGSDSEDLTAGAVTNEDGTVTVQVYENLGGHNSTAAWYQVDRLTGQGTDVNSGEAVDLSAAA